MDYLSLNALESAVLKDEVCGEHRTPAREMLWDSAGATLRGQRRPQVDGQQTWI